jgi:cation diffusion facilitator CzcD-associated flavoprotein CzcO
LLHKSGEVGSNFGSNFGITKNPISTPSPNSSSIGGVALSGEIVRDGRVVGGRRLPHSRQGYEETRTMSIVRLSDRVRCELTYLSCPPPEWTIPRYRDGARVLDVLVIGGGQGGLATAFGLKLDGITNIRVVDRNPRGLEGPWRRFARMPELRTPKEVTGIDLGIPSLTARAWYEARFGRHAWERIDKISPQVWHKYLDWYRDVLDLPVENEVEVTSIEPADDLLLVHLLRTGQIERVHARKIVLATGIEGSGCWRAPRALVAELSAERYAHSADNIDFRRLAGKRVGVLGVGASALDNAAAALEAGATRVDLCFRRPDFPRVNPLVWMNFPGMLGHFGELSDLERWRFMRHVLQELPVPPPQDAFWRCRGFENFVWHANCVWHSVRNQGDVVTVQTEAGTFTFDFIIFATGVDTDLSARPELATFVHQIALWRDRFTPPLGEESDVLARHPYLGKAFEFMEREPGTAPFLSRLHNFTLGATPSLGGITGAAITGLRYGVRRLVDGLVRDLFREDAATYYRDLLAYAVPELETLESAFTWIDRLATEALSARKLMDHLERAVLAKGLHGELVPQVPNSRPARILLERIRIPITPVKRRRRAK